ncbi:MAG: sulfite oxidase-like oxidoreductase [bacterium]|nr:sulfite oxidase-like oxidoreductase [bacterium]
MSIMSRLRKTLPDGVDPSRLPPGQYNTRRFPVLHVGATPKVKLDRWDFKVDGLVETPVSWSFEEMTSLPRTERVCDIHCVTKWSKFDTLWEGIAVTEVLSRVEILPRATHVMVIAEHGFTSNLPLGDFDRPENLFALRYDGADLTPDHGWPMRLVVPHLYFWKSVKWVRGLLFMESDQPGFWERNGYHMRGDPWAEERYWGD